MSNQNSLAHETVAWTKQRLDELDAMISEAEKNLGELKDEARKDADDALARFRHSRDKLKDYADSLRDDAVEIRLQVEEIQDKLEVEWIEVETAFQSYLSVIREQAGSARDLVAARLKAQRRTWQEALEQLRVKAAESVDEARKEADAAIGRLSDEVQKIQGRVGTVKGAGDESWEAVKAGVAEARAAHDRTIRKIKDAFSALL
ncbi:hypothetical protein [Paracoccus sp. FO-3]|uniref:hypothetical protein n=1 Tax=Paracoccus sp. FO-3 TaxID=1335059 RepID=UPI00112A91C7|nr:hypothetical protein [Paracoccus sp. FO-3]